ncbi:uncharacterized protein [Chironomus tepperi]|uniref:uncharacterized protein n=1 Tax=Chironomus tepperi TaxID=113505 RepID=UPI00391F552D
MDIFTEKYCRFCLKESTRRIKLLKIDKTIEESFYELTQINLSKHSVFLNLSNSICIECSKNLNKCITTKNLFIEKQTELEKKATGFNSVNIKTENVDPVNSIKVEYNNENSNDNDFDFSEHFSQSYVDCDSNDLKEDLVDTVEQTNSVIDEPKPKKKKREKKECTLCGSKVKNLKEHFKYTHNQVSKKYFCDKCSFGCYFKHKIEIHVQQHIPKQYRDLIECAHCEFKCSRKDTLKKHFTSFHTAFSREKNVLCTECDKAYYSISQLNNHIRNIHHNIRNYGCPHCEKKFFTTKDLNLHVPRHFDKKEKCPRCDLMFYTVAEVRSHIKRVHLPPTVSCSYEGCEKKFATNEMMKKHVKIRHQKLKEFVCVECGCPFAQYNTMKRHMDTVHRSLRVQCPVENCGFSMKRKEKFRQHLIKYHKELDEEAREAAIKSLEYKSEEQQTHVTEFPCTECGKMFTKYHNLKRHVAKGHVKKVYPRRLFYCPLDNCSYKISGKYRVKIHLQRKHQCDENTVESLFKDIKFDVIEVT